MSVQMQIAVSMTHYYTRGAMYILIVIVIVKFVRLVCAFRIVPEWPRPRARCVHEWDQMLQLHDLIFIHAS